MSSSAKRENFYGWLDFFRWVAALSVLWTHAGLKMLSPLREVEHRSAMRLAYAVVAGFDHYAVMVFFVLSGYLVGGSLVSEYRHTGQVDIRSYLAKRFIRLWVVLCPAFLLTLLADLLTVKLGGIEMNLYSPAIWTHLSPTNLVCNAAFLQMFACVQYGENGPLWSLFNELWYYVAFPLLLLAGAAGVARWARLALFLVAAGGLTVLTIGQFEAAAIGPYMLIWLFGAIAASRRRPLVRSMRSSAAMFVLVLLVIRVCVRADFVASHALFRFSLDTIVALVFANLLLTMRKSASLRSPPGGVWLNQKAAGFSFSNYCIHIPVLSLYIAVMEHLSGNGLRMSGARVEHWTVLFGGLVICIVSAWLFSLGSERHTNAIRGWVMGWLTSALDQGVDRFRRRRSRNRRPPAKLMTSTGAGRSLQQGAIDSAAG